MKRLAIVALCLSTAPAFAGTPRDGSRTQPDRSTKGQITKGRVAKATTAGAAVPARTHSPGYIVPGSPEEKAWKQRNAMESFMSLNPFYVAAKQTMAMTQAASKATLATPAQIATNLWSMPLMFSPLGYGARFSPLGY